MQCHCFTHSNTAGAQQSLESPKIVNLPRLPRESQQKYSEVEDQLRQSLAKLTKQQRRRLNEFISNTLYSDHPEGKQPKIPHSSRDLFNHLQKYWNKVSIDALMQLADHLRDAALKTMVEEYRQALYEFLRNGNEQWSQPTPLQQPAGYTTLEVKMNSSPLETAAIAINRLAFWADKLKEIGSSSGISILLAGLTTDGTSLVFLVSELYIIELFQWAQQNMGIIHKLSMETFTVPDQVMLNTESGKTVSSYVHTYCTVGNFGGIFFSKTRKCGTKQ